MKAAPPPERIAKIPQQWVRDYIEDLTSHIRFIEEENQRLDRQLAMASGSFDQSDTNVRVQVDDLDIPLPRDSTVTFSSAFEVEPSANDPHGITIELVSSGGLVIIPAEEGRMYVRSELEG